MPDPHSGDPDHGHGSSSVFMYLRHFRDFWHSPINRHVVDQAELRPDERALDIGAGMGPAVVIAASMVAKGEVVAVDPSFFMRRVLHIRRLFQGSRRRIRIMDGTAEHLPLPEGSIDAAWAVNSMHHWADPKAAAGEILRALRPGGRVILLDEDFDHPDHRFQTSCECHADHPSMVDIHVFADLFTSAGFVNVSAEQRHVGDVPVLLLQAAKPG
jgi:SAM-dependent methyltransferase